MGDLGKLIVAKGFKKSPKVQKIARSGHAANNAMFKFSLTMKAQMFERWKFTVQTCPLQGYELTTIFLVIRSIADL